MKKNSNPSPIDRKRLVGISIFIFMLFSILIFQFYRIQIIEGDKWSSVAQKQHYFIVKEPFVRGSFISNTAIKRGHPEKPQRFVVDIEKFHLYVDPFSIPKENRNAISDKLMSMLDLSVQEQSALRAQFNIKSRSRKLAMWLDKETRDAVMEWWLPYARENEIVRNALFFVTDYQRSYPFGKLLGQVLHTVQNQKDTDTMQSIPTGGLELYFNSYLKGKQGKRRLMRSPRHSLEMGEVIESPQNGADIYLTINHCLQAIAEEELAKGVQKANAKSGWAIMMDPKTGEILALAQYPFFYPPDYQHYFNDPLLIEHTKVKAITDGIEPGSIMKPMTMTAGLLANEELKKRGEKPLFDPLEKMSTSNSRFPGRSKPLTDTHMHNYLNMYMAIQKSSNIYVARIVERIIDRLGNEWYSTVLRDYFKFGEKTNIELPAESKGVVPTLGKKHPNGTFEWSTATPFSLAMGYNIQTTSMQHVRAYCMFANGGYLVSPTLVRKIVRVDENGEEQVLFDNTLPERVQKFPRILAPEMINKVVTGMKYSTKTGGTARRADIYGYTEAGKTSTAKKIVNGQYVDTYRATFVGFAPLSNPAFVLLVCMDEPEFKFITGVGKNHHGGTCCAPVFREIGKRSLEYLGIAPDDPYGYPVGDPRYSAGKADWAKEVKAMQETYDNWNK